MLAKMLGKVVCVVLLLGGPAVYGQQPSRGARTQWVAEQTSGPLVSDAQFFDALNLDYPGLEKVKAACQAGDFEKAKQTLADYFRQRQKPLYFYDPNQPIQPQAGADTSAADRALAHIFHGSAIDAYPPQPMGPKIDWTLEPVGDREWTWSLNRHYFWLTMAEAYRATGDEKYARGFSEQLCDWVRNAPVPPKSMRDATPTWRTIEAGIRMFSTWMPAYYRFLPAKGFTTEARILFYKSLIEHARFLLNNPSGGNWLTMEMDGLAHIGVLFPEFKEAQQWREFAYGRLAKELTSQVYPDGAQTELTTGYHDVALWNFLMPLKLARLNGTRIPDSYERDIIRMFEFDMLIAKPNCKPPCFNDSDPYDYSRDTGAGSADLGLLLKGAELFGRQDMLYVASRGTQGKPPAECSHAFPYAGIFVMRSGWEKDARFLALDAGPFGAGHQHEDKLSFEMAAFDRTFLVDPGRYSYADSPYRSYFLRTQAHNTILVDGQGQHRRTKHPKYPHVVRQPLDNTWISSSLVDLVEGCYDEGYGEKSEIGVTHRRKVVFVKPDYWVVADELAGTGTHTVQSLLHFAPTKLQVNQDKGEICTTDPDQANLSVVSFADRPLSIETVTGQENPVQGWIAPGYGEKIAAPVAVLSAKGELPMKMGYCLFPMAKRQAVSPKLERLEVKTAQGASSSAVAMVIAHADVQDTLLLDDAASSQAKTCAGLSSDGQLAFVRRVDGRVTSMTLARGRSLEAAKDARIELSDGQTSGACDVEYLADQVRIESRTPARVTLAGRTKVVVNGKPFASPEGTKPEVVEIDAHGNARFAK